VKLYYCPGKFGNNYVQRQAEKAMPIKNANRF